jgi:hypothetical protein
VAFLPPVFHSDTTGPQVTVACVSRSCHIIIFIAPLVLYRGLRGQREEIQEKEGGVAALVGQPIKCLN